MTGVLEIVVITFIIYWFFGTRAFAMVGVLSNRRQGAYLKWDCADSSERKPSSSNRGKRGSYRREKNNDVIQEFRDRELFRSKEVCWSGFSVRAGRPLLGGCCKTCTPHSKVKYHGLWSPAERSEWKSLDKNVPEEEEEEENLEEKMPKSVVIKTVRNILEPDAMKDESFIARVFCHLTQNFRIKKYNYPQVAYSVLTDERLRDAIVTTAQTLASSVPEEEQSEEQYREILRAQEARAKRILFDMRSTLSDFLLRITSWILYKLLPRFLTSVCLHPTQLEMLRRASETNLPMIFVPLHRSHLDYILITFILLNIDVKSPLVAAGNNLKIPVFGRLLRGLGAFFIKRRIDPTAGKKDVLYRAVLHTYMMQCLEAGHNIEFYIEGGRTRTGKPCMPKSGLLSVIIDAYMAGKLEDALLIPVSVNYDKLVDGNFIRELLGQPKEMETFSSAISAIWTTLNSNYGSMRVDFNQPFSLKELVKSFQAVNKLKRQSSSDLASVESSPTKNGCPSEKVFRSIPSTTSLYGTDVVDEDHRVLVDSIARHLIYDCAKACAVMSTNILAFLLLNKYRGGAKLYDLTSDFDLMREQLLADNRDIGFSGYSIDVINNAVDLLGPSLVERKIEKSSEESYEIITPVTRLPNVIELSYYSNGLLPHFMIEGVVGIAIKASAKTIKLHGDDLVKISVDRVLNHALRLCDILQFEFIFSKPCQSLESMIKDVFEKFQLMYIIFTEENSYLRTLKWQKRFATIYDSEDEDRCVQNKYEGLLSVNTNKKESDRLEFYSMLLRPLIDVYVEAATCLPSLLNKQVPENDFVQEVLSDIQAKLENGVCLFSESSSVEPIKNACKLFKKWGVLEMYSENSVRFLNLTDEYNNPDMLASIQTKIELYKNKAAQTF